MEVDLQSLFGHHVTRCAQLHLLAQTPLSPPSPRIWAHTSWAATVPYPKHLVTQCPFKAETTEKLRRGREQQRCRRQRCRGGGRAAQLLLPGLGRRYAYPLQLQPDLQVSVPGGRSRALREQLQRRIAAKLWTIADAVRERGGGVGGPYKDGGRHPGRLWGAVQVRPSVPSHRLHRRNTG